ncbi:nucleotide-diphospho-sugar transferase [Scheffersomyces xylosifermentans]|uniref:nucleotide-diphospho-sugar transferase n=1 Tax=Scheffersomyces xylosifermentans TaxID=1304137 RepID=UPI00315DC1D4
MRKELKYIIWAHVALIVYLVYCTFDLITLLHDDSFADALLDVELNPVDGQIERPIIIPKIIHQTYKTTQIPEIWKPGQQACVDLHPDYQYILWTDEMAREFIAEEYPWFLKTWDSYPYPIERADAIRYFALVHYGGVYIDLDDGCERRLDPLLTVPAFVRKTIPTGISNDVMGAVPKHPFFLKVLDSLQTYKRNWFVPYITIMYSTGPLFLSVVWKQYKRWGVPEAGKVRILMPDDYKTHIYSFFAIAPGSSWHLDDAKFIKGLAHHIGLAVFAGFLIAGLVFYLEYLFYSWVISNNFKKLIVKLSGFVYVLASPLINLVKLNKNIKRRSRKDSNLPIEFSILEKLNSEESDVIFINDSCSASDNLIQKDENAANVAAITPLNTIDQSSESDNDGETYVAKNNDNIV